MLEPINNTYLGSGDHHAPLNPLCRYRDREESIATECMKQDVSRYNDVLLVHRC